ncbi:hypothetical protein [Thermovenabulum gondwanense]|uniref:Uncharacterized protein n=1 Tax=Thermovenabulum gondwanense TaxID=520767 RepID=A0A162ML00_9FIRM|nr:hypothetical protein [Thermovenabulum gondwanense]KYO66523.1 hypothetical protein ATZ99_11510 [Thermovenabulum gondwanense]
MSEEGEKIERKCETEEIKAEIAGAQEGEKDEKRDVENLFILSKKILRHTIITGKMENSLKTAANSFDFLKALVDSLASISSIAREKLIESAEETEINNTLLQGKKLFAPLLLNILHTEEFKQIMANTLVQVLNDK